jgi:hypothetical protein
LQEQFFLVRNRVLSQIAKVTMAAILVLDSYGIIWAGFRAIRKVQRSQAGDRRYRERLRQLNMLVFEGGVRRGDGETGEQCADAGWRAATMSRWSLQGFDGVSDGQEEARIG